MELNGPANIVMIVNLALLNKKIDHDTAMKVLEQCNLLCEYMNMYKNSTTVNWPIKPWHTIREEYNARTTTIK